jgi:hypothetical protein
VEDDIERKCQSSKTIVLKTTRFWSIIKSLQSLHIRYWQNYVLVKPSRGFGCNACSPRHMLCRQSYANFCYILITFCIYLTQSTLNYQLYRCAIIPSVILSSVINMAYKIFWSGLFLLVHTTGGAIASGAYCTGGSRKQEHLASYHISLSTVTRILE